MTESDVKVTATALLDAYEEKTGKPRHDQNLANFQLIFDFISRAKGAFMMAAVVVGLPAVTASLIVIIKFAQGK